MFRETTFNQPVGGWNVSKVYNMGSMFVNNSSFDQPIEDWNVSSVTDIRGHLLSGASL